MRKPASAGRRWALQDAKNKFSEVVDAAARGEPQVVTRRGVETAVVIGHRDYADLAGRRRDLPTLGQYLSAGVGRATGEPFERIRLNARDEV